MRNVRAVAFVLASSIVVPGCAVLEPQVHSPRLFDSVYGGKAAESGKPATDAVFVGDLAKAIDDANAQSKLYFNASGLYSTYRNSVALGAGLTGLSAVMLGVLSHGSQDLRLGLAGVAAGTLGLGGYFDNRARQLVYLSGASAIQCAVIAQRPLLITRTQQEALHSDVSHLRSAITHFASDLQQNQPRPSGAQLYGLPEATTAQGNATNTVSDAEQFQKMLDSSGIALREKVKSIVIAVDTQIVKTDPDLQSVQKVITSVGSNIPKIVSSGTASVEASKNPQRSTGGGDWFDSDVVALITLTHLVQADLKDISASIQAANSTMAAATDACKVQDLPGALKVDPDETSHNVTTLPTTVVYSIRGGMLPVTASLTGEFPAGVFAVTQTSSGSTIQVSVAITKDAKDQQATLNISDASGGAPHLIVIKVNSSATVSPTSANTTPQSHDQQGQAQPDQPKKQKKQKVTPSNTSATLTTQQLTLVRRVLGITTGAGSPTLTSDDEAALKKYATDHSLISDLTPSGPLYQALLASARVSAEQLTTDADERALITQNVIAPLRIACGLPPAATPDMSFDKPLRDKIFDFEALDQKNMPSDPEIDGKLDQIRLNLMLAAQCVAPKRDN